MDAAVDVAGVSHRYGDRTALDGVSLALTRGEIFGLLGPNGGGKTTLFRLLTTLLPVQTGRIAICGRDVQADPAGVRSRLGITFQSPSLDGKLTVRENLHHQGHLYGLMGASLKSRIEQVTGWLALGDRLNERTDVLSGGLKRRVEIAKSLLHGPEVLVLDEPSTGLDPGVRFDLWEVLTRVRSEQNVTVLVTTHLMDEAERCDRLAILDRGRLVALGTPQELRSSVGGDSLTIAATDPEGLAARIAERFGVVPKRLGDELRIEHAGAIDLLRELVAAFPDDIAAISLAKPSLEDVFIDRTGHRFWDAAPSS
ncbi:MAG: ATP-binding cassette domain-containing protein [Planctomycetaceae bacterium]|nr:ATP-binding cassette domain-containing protein [Planctomycetaceae bacterium]